VDAAKAWCRLAVRAAAAARLARAAWLEGLRLRDPDLREGVCRDEVFPSDAPAGFAAF
jgi:hypothetical protein